MSLSLNKTQVLCDGVDCQAVTSPPIALRSQLLPPDRRLPTGEGWLFITDNGYPRHYCPRCAEQFLQQITEREAASARWR